MSTPEPSEHPPAAGVDLPDPFDLLKIDVNATSLLDSKPIPAPNTSFEERLKGAGVSAEDAARWGPALDSQNKTWVAWYKLMRAEGHVLFEGIVAEFRLKCEQLQADYDRGGRDNN
jgi:hypothetical protein